MMRSVVNTLVINLVSQYRLKLIYVEGAGRVQPITREGQARVISSAFASQIFQIIKFEISDEDQKQKQKTQAS